MIPMLIALVGSAFLVLTGFVFVFTVQRLIESDVWCPWYFKVVAIVWLLIGAIADIAFNWLWGTVIFRELPHELMFTSRVKRHYGRTDGNWRQRRAARWRELLNAVDPGHVA